MGNDARHGLAEILNGITQAQAPKDPGKSSDGTYFEYDRAFRNNGRGYAVGRTTPGDVGRGMFEASKATPLTGKFPTGNICEL